MKKIIVLMMLFATCTVASAQKAEQMMLLNKIEEIGNLSTKALEFRGKVLKDIPRNISPSDYKKIISKFDSIMRMTDMYQETAIKLLEVVKASPEACKEKYDFLMENLNGIKDGFDKELFKLYRLFLD
jgi:hypothetical protein